jgi:hypothetical protein
MIKTLKHVQIDEYKYKTNIDNSNQYDINNYVFILQGHLQFLL